MPLSDELKKIYSANPVSERFYDTIEISHSLFSKIYYLVKDKENHNWQLEDTNVVTFEGFGLDIIKPKVGDVQQNISFVFDNVGREAMPELEAAAELITEPIKLVYRTYIDGSDLPQSSAMTLFLTNIVADNHTVTAVATRSDLYKRKVPTGNKAYFDQRFYGLFL